MRLDTISTIAEIWKYYGTLDRVYKLMKGLSIRTSNIWSKTKVKLQTDIKKKTIESCFNKAVMSFFEQNPILITLFHYSKFILETECEYKQFLSFLDIIENPEMFDWEIVFLLYKYDSVEISISNIENFCNDNELNNLALYNQIIRKMKDKGFAHSNLNSYVYIQDLSKIEEWEYIHSLLIVQGEEDDEDGAIDEIASNWRRFKMKSNWEINNVKIILVDSFEKYLPKIIKLIDHNNIEIIFDNSNFIEFMRVIYEIDIPIINKISVKCISEEDYIMHSIKGELFTSLKRMQMNWSNRSHIKIFDNFKIIRNEERESKRLITEILHESVDEFFKWTFDIYLGTHDDETK